MRLPGLLVLIDGCGRCGASAGGFRFHKEVYEGAWLKRACCRAVGADRSLGLHWLRPSTREEVDGG
jgi:hypothetical protein